MKDRAQKYLHTLRTFIPGLGGVDSGHNAARDWYLALSVVAVMLVSLIFTGIYRFIDINNRINQSPETLPVRGLVVVEEDVFEIKHMFDERASEYEGFTREAPKAPNPGIKETATAETTTPESTMPE